MAFVRMGARHKGVAAFNLVHQPVGQKKIKGPIDCNWCGP